MTSQGSTAQWLLCGFDNPVEQRSCGLDLHPPRSVWEVVETLRVGSNGSFRLFWGMLSQGILGCCPPPRLLGPHEGAALPNYVVMWFLPSHPASSPQTQSNGIWQLPFLNQQLGTRTLNIENLFPLHGPLRPPSPRSAQKTSVQSPHGASPRRKQAPLILLRRGWHTHLSQPGS